MATVISSFRRWWHGAPESPSGAAPPDEPAAGEALSERPIDSENQDVLERGRFVERLATSLIGRNSGQASGIVMGLTGSWGSGKSSLLNLLSAHIEKMHPNAVLVRFDPWLVSGRNDLIGEFIGELLAAVNEKIGKDEKYRQLATTLLEYGDRMSPVLDHLPHGKILTHGLKAAKAALARQEGVTALRKRLLSLLKEFPHPIVVLIDELDRVEEEEIRTVAQLVRSVADFPGISYLLAYDRDRVAEALGHGNISRGQAYLEKIVQLQIPLPITFSEEMARLLRAELQRMQEFSLPPEFWNLPRYQRQESLLVSKVLTTLRDVKRLTGTFHAVFGLVYGEADWIDVLGYAALLTKASATVAEIAKDPERVVNNPLSSVEAIRRAGRGNLGADTILNEIVPKAEDRPEIRSLLTLIFPVLSKAGGAIDYADPISDRRTLLTVLRLGILPGAWSRERVMAFFSQAPAEIAEGLRKLNAEDGLGALVDRLDDIYDDLGAVDYLNMWRGIGEYLRRTPEQGRDTIAQMYWRIDAFATLMVRWSERKPELRPGAVQIIEALRLNHEISLVSHWLHRHAFVYGLFGRERRNGNRWFLSDSDTERMSREQSNVWKADLLNGQLLKRSWDAVPIFVMVAVGDWDERSRAALEEQLASGPETIDTLTLMLFGPDYSTDKASVAIIVDLPRYLMRIKARLSEAGDHPPSELVRIALGRARETIEPDQ